MKTFLFQIEIKPATNNPARNELKGGSAIIWVIDENATTAQDRAFAYIKDHAWTPIRVESACESTPEQIARLDTEESKVYQQAVQSGIFGHFHAWPHKPRPGIYSVETLKNFPKG